MLAVDASGKSASVALVSDGELVGEMNLHAGYTHSETLLPMIDELLSATRTPIRAVDLFAVTVGPGSFTGLRIGIATVKGLAFPGNIPCVPVSTLEAAAMNLADADGVVCAALDARRDQVYAALFEGRKGKLVRLFEDEPISLAQLEGRLAQTEGQPVRLVGDGATLVQNALGDRIPDVRLASEALRLPRASSVARVAMEHLADAIPGDQLMPRYLRLSQAERERQAKQETDPDRQGL